MRPGGWRLRAIRPSPGFRRPANVRVGSDEASAAATFGALPCRSNCRANGKQHQLTHKEGYSMTRIWHPPPKADLLTVLVSAPRLSYGRLRNLQWFQR
jgi:hypothetical protein